MLLGWHKQWKDLVLVMSILMALGGCWFAYIQKKKSLSDLGRLMKDLEGLQRAEQSLLELQEKLVHYLPLSSPKFGLNSYSYSILPAVRTPVPSINRCTFSLFN